MDNLEIESLIAEKIDKAVADALANREAESRAITERLSRVEETLLARKSNNNEYQGMSPSIAKVTLWMKCLFLGI